MVNENWGNHGTPFDNFDEEITRKWKTIRGMGFSANTAREWLNVGLKETDWDFAYYLELQGKTPEWVLNHGNEKDLRKKYKKWLKTNPEKKKPKTEQEAKPHDPHKCQICEDNTFYSFKGWKTAHPERQHKKDPWIVVMKRPIKNLPNYRTYIEICEECRHPEHLNNCSWFKSGNHWTIATIAKT